MDLVTLKESVCKAIEEHAEEFAEIARDVGAEPELGYKEFKTAEKVRRFFDKWEIPNERGLAVTGLKAPLNRRVDGPTVAILGELDGIICSDAPDADPVTHATHTCGHNVQLAGMLAAALGLRLSGVLDHLDGNVVAMAVPAEEYIEIEQRKRMREEGKIHFLSGKQELVYRGAMDDIDMSIMFHARRDTPGRKVSLCTTSNGFFGKTVRFLGNAVHAAESPECGINSLNAALVGLTGLNAMRETFPDRSNIRVHSVITKGGDAVSSIPSKVEVETLVRGNSIESMRETSQKIDRAFMGGAHAVGAGIHIETVPGHCPMACSDALNALFRENARTFLPEEDIEVHGHFNASTDLGDVSLLMPSIHPFVGGAVGNLHSKEFRIIDYETALILPAKLMAMTTIDLLYHGAEKAREVLDAFVPTFASRQDYVTFMEKGFETKKENGLISPAVGTPADEVL